MTTNGTQTAKITLHWLNKSCAQRIVWLMEELNLEYDLKLYLRTKDMLAPPELKEVHPLGKSPVLEIQTPDMAKPVVLAESGAIVEYLTDHFGPSLAPKKFVEGKEGQIGGESESWLRYRYYMHYTEGTLMKISTVAIIFNSLKNAPAPFFIKPLIKMIVGKIETLFVGPNLQLNYGFLEEQLASSPEGGDFLCGKELTGADIMIVFVLELGKRFFGLTAEKYPKLSAYLEKQLAREAYKKGAQKTADLEKKQ